MKKVGIITIYDNSNFGNRLQNYATQECIKKLRLESVTLKNLRRCNEKPKNFIDKIKITLIFIIKIIQNYFKKTKKERNFEKFNKEYINLSKGYITANNAKCIEKKYDYFLVGSDQVWNPKFKRMSYIDLLGFTDKNKKASFAASFGIAKLNEEEKSKFKKYISDYEYVSVRENEGKEIIENICNTKKVEVLLDPTMILDTTEWDKIIKKPNCLKSKKYILLYFLGKMEKEWQDEIDKIAKKYECDVINILDKNSDFYNIRPDEFVYLEKNAFLVCTDSFHSTVFAILYKRPFIVFERITKSTNMNSRLNTLLKKFKLESNKFDEEIDKIDLENMYKNVDNILKEERKKSMNYLKKALGREVKSES